MSTRSKRRQSRATNEDKPKREEERAAQQEKAGNKTGGAEEGGWQRAGPGSLVQGLAANQASVAPGTAAGTGVPGRRRQQAQGTPLDPDPRTPQDDGPGVAEAAALAGAGQADENAPGQSAPLCQPSSSSFQEQEGHLQPLGQLPPLAEPFAIAPEPAAAQDLRAHSLNPQPLHVHKAEAAAPAGPSRPAAGPAEEAGAGPAPSSVAFPPLEALAASVSAPEGVGTSDGGEGCDTEGGDVASQRRAGKRRTAHAYSEGEEEGLDDGEGEEDNNGDGELSEADMAGSGSGGGPSRRAGESGSGGGGGRSAKKPRLVWTAELHARFMNAVNHLGVKHAVPKTILQLMNVEGMTRENVASHLQKYRLYLKRLAGYPSSARLPLDTLQQVQQAIQAQGHPPLFQEGGGRGLQPGIGFPGFMLPGHAGGGVAAQPPHGPFAGEGPSGGPGEAVTSMHMYPWMAGAFPGQYGAGMQPLPQLAGFGQVPGSFPAHDAAVAAAAVAQNYGWVWGMVGGVPSSQHGRHPAGMASAAAEAAAALQRQQQSHHGHQGPGFLQHSMPGAGFGAHSMVQASSGQLADDEDAQVLEAAQFLAGGVPSHQRHHSRRMRSFAQHEEHHAQHHDDPDEEPDKHPKAHQEEQQEDEAAKDAVAGHAPDQEHHNGEEQAAPASMHAPEQTLEGA